jgi:hypothetical protein
MSVQSSYKSIRDQLITISVSIDDKDKLNKLIERKIEQERSLLAEVESSLSREYERILEVFVLE